MHRADNFQRVQVQYYYWHGLIDRAGLGEGLGGFLCGLDGFEAKLVGISARGQVAASG